MKFPFSLVPHDTNIDFIGKRWIAFTCSILATIAVFILLFTKGLNLGIDFTGGIILEVRTQEVVPISSFRDTLSENNYPEATIQNFGSPLDIMIRVQPKNTNDQLKEVEEIKSILFQNIDSKIEFRKTDYVGPKAGDDIIFSGIAALLLALLAMMIYIWVRFNWQFGIGAILALFHDMIITTGFYIVTGFEFNLTSIAALLTVIGYSINDSVVIYDRIRENLRRYKITDISEVINRSINETLSRTTMTALTTLVVCLALVLFGGDVILGFSATIFFGIAFGTYSSIYISAPALIYTGITTKKI